MPQEQEHSETVVGIGNIMLGGGLIGAVYLLSPVPIMELFQWAALILLPIMAVAFGAGLVSMGTLKLVWNQQLSAKVQQYVVEERERRANKTAATAAEAAA